MTDQRQLWPWAIDWQGGLVQSAEFKTEIFASRDMHEFRRAARETARFSYEYSGSAKGAEAQAIVRVLETLIGETLVFANPIFRTTLDSPLVGATSVFTMASIPDWLVVGSYIVFENQGERFLAIVDFIDVDEITLDANTTTTFPVGSTVLLGVRCRVNSKTQVTYRTNQVITGKITLEDLPGLNYNPGDGTPYSLYNGKEVFLKKPNWAQSITRNMDAAVDVVDFDYGRVSHNNYLDFVPSIWKAEYLGKTWDDAIELLQFFIRQRGRRGEFYMPSQTADLPLALGLTSGQSTFRVFGAEYADYASNPAQRHVVIALKDGTQLFRRVSGIVADGAQSVFTVTAAWGSSVSLDQISYVGWLATYRFAVDEMSVEWLTDSVAQFSTSFQLLRDLDESL